MALALLVPIMNENAGLVINKLHPPAKIRRAWWAGGHQVDECAWEFSLKMYSACEKSLSLACRIVRKVGLLCRDTSRIKQQPPPLGHHRPVGIILL